MVADQLRLRGGKVRCGVCHTVFDARAQQVAIPPSPSASVGAEASAANAATPAPQAPVWRAAPAPSRNVPRNAPRNAPGEGEAMPLREHGTMTANEDGILPTSPRLTGARTQEPVIGPGVTPARQHSGKREPVFSADRMPTPASDDAFLDEPDGDDETDFEAADADIEIGQDVTEAENFVATRHPVRTASRRRRSSRLSAMFWRTACVLAGLALVLQALWWWRTPLATYVPVLRPVYEKVCAGLGCAAGYVRRPTQLSIESSSMHPEALARADSDAQRMVLTALLRNRAEHPQPWPTIELSLTDFSDTVVVRRLIEPQEYLGSDVPPAFAGHSERAVNVSVTVRGIPVSGYRLALFFP